MASSSKLNFKDGFFDWLSAVIFAVIVVVLIFTFTIRTVSVSGTSMLPTFNDKDTLLMCRLYTNPKYGDVVVLTKPIDGDEPLIKRVIATEGQEINIDFKKGEVYVDGKLLNEPYIFEETQRSADMTFPQIVPEGCVFVLGDNRNNSLDSRWGSVGMIDKRYIAGKVMFRLLPDFEKIG